MGELPEIGEGDWLRRTAHVVRQAAAVLGDAEARQWLQTPCSGFGGRTPLEMLATDAGSREVENSLGHTAERISPN